MIGSGAPIGATSRAKKGTCFKYKSLPSSDF